MRLSTPKLVTAAGWTGLAFWLYYAFLRQVIGPLNPDEVYFAHILWLVNEGRRQYVDFNSNHLPTYFHLLTPLVSALSASSSDLSYVWGVRILSALVILAYLGLTWALHRHAIPNVGRIGLLGLAALVLVFVVAGRMVEVRVDTVGLLLINAAWTVVLCFRTTRATLAAALLAGLALLFSARAAGMVAVVGSLLLYLAVRSRDARTVRALLYAAGSFFTAGVAACLLAPDWAALVIRSCFLEPAKLLAGSVPLRARFLAFDRLPLTLLIAGGLFGSWRLMRAGAADRGLVIAMACGAQLLLVLLDPAPYQYVYGWAAVPAVVGIVSVSPLFSVSFPFLMAAGLVSASIGYGVVKGEAPPTASYLRLTVESALSERELAELPTRQLVTLLVTDARQKNLTSQLRVRSEVCRRMDGLSLTTFDTNPVCLHDAMFHWTDLHWPPLAEGDLAAPGAMSWDSFANVIQAARPSLIIWAHRWNSPRPLRPETRQLLECCYEISDGFAISRTVLAGNRVAK